MTSDERREQSGGGILDVDDMRLLVVLGEELHFGRAAARLHLSQPGLSYRVKRMEEALGYELVSRSRRSVELTSAGAAVLQGSQRLLGDVRQLVDDGARIARGEIATLHVGFAWTALYGLLPPVLRATQQRYPELQLLLEEMKSVAQATALASGRLDVGLLHLPLPPDSGLVSVAATTDRVGLALPEDHRLAHEAAIDLAELAADPFVLFPREREPQTYDSYVQACVTSGFAPRVAHRATGLPTILGMVAAGMGVAFVSEAVARDSSRSGVVFRPIIGPAPRLTIGPVWRPDVDKPGVALFRDVVLEIAAGRSDQSR